MAWISPVMVRNTSRSTPESANGLKRIAPPERCQTIGDTTRYYSRSEEQDGYSQRPVPGGAHGEDGIGAIDRVIDRSLSARRAGEWSSAACAGRRRARRRTPL